MSRISLTLTVLAASCLAAGAPAFAQKAPAPAPAKEREAKLIAVLNTSDAPEKARADACRELGRIGTCEAVAPLAALLCDEKLSHMARYGLEPIPDPAVDVALRDALGKLKGRHLVGVIGSIGVRRDLKSVEPLIKLLGDSDPEVAQAAARALGRIGTLEAAQALEKALTKAPEANRQSLSEGLFRAADVLRTQGQRGAAKALYAKLRTAEVPEYIRASAARAETNTRP